MPLVRKITKNYMDRRMHNKKIAAILSFDEKTQAEAEARVKDGAM